MLAIEVRHFELGIVAALTAALAAVAMPRAPGPSAPGIPEPSAEPVTMRHTATVPIACDAPGITTVVFRGRVTALDPDQLATFHFRFADLPSRYSVMTGAHGAFEIRVPREELGMTDLCHLPSSGQRPARFADSSMAIQFELSFER